MFRRLTFFLKRRYTVDTPTAVANLVFSTAFCVLWGMSLRVSTNVAFTGLLWLLVVATGLAVGMSLLKVLFFRNTAEELAAAKRTQKGALTVDAAGFTLQVWEKGDYRVLWEEIDTLLTYKRDLWAVDQVCLEVWWGRQKVVTHEEMQGWSEFTQALETHIPAIDPGWKIRVLHPPFELNLAVVYDRAGRTLEALNIQ